MLDWFMQNSVQAKRVRTLEDTVLSSLEIIPSLRHTDPLRVCSVVPCAFLHVISYKARDNYFVIPFSFQPQPLFTLLSIHSLRDHTSPGYHTQLEPSPTLSCLTLYMRMKCCATSFLVRMLSGTAGLL